MLFTSLAFDPNWFYSSLAQSAAGIVGLLGGVLATRLQSQIALTTAQRVKSTQALKDAHYALGPAIASLSAFERVTMVQTRTLREELAKGTIELDLEEWYAPFDRNAPCRTEVSERILQLEIARGTLGPNYRMKLTRLGHGVLSGTDSPPCPGWLAETCLGLQLMRGR